MGIRWADLLNHLGIEWTDSSRYAGRGRWIGIRCPWCGSQDSGFHLGLSLQFSGYHCLRSEAHRGRSLPYLLRALGVDRAEIDTLLHFYGGEARSSRYEPPPPRPVSPFVQRWQRLQPAADDPEALTYLSQRNFTDPVRVAKEYDLRTARGGGQLARRIWFKLTDLNGNVVGCTGRAMDKHHSGPRYYTQCSDPGTTHSAVNLSYTCRAGMPGSV